MAIKLTGIIEKYVAASNRRDVESILACFLDVAVVRVEGDTLKGKRDIEDWIAKTIKEYKFRFKTLDVKTRGAEIIVGMKASGAFDGSPVNLGYHFLMENDKISCLIIKKAVRQIPRADFQGDTDDSPAPERTMTGPRSVGRILARATAP